MTYLADELAHQTQGPQTEREHRLLESGGLIGFALGGAMMAWCRTDNPWVDTGLFVVSLIILHVSDAWTRIRHLEDRWRDTLTRWLRRFQ